MYGELLPAEKGRFGCSDPVNGRTSEATIALEKPDPSKQRINCTDLSARRHAAQRSTQPSDPSTQGELATHWEPCLSRGKKLRFSLPPKWLTYRQPRSWHRISPASISARQSQAHRD